MNMRVSAERASVENFRIFRISFNILLVLLILKVFISETYTFSGLKLHLHTQSMTFPVITYGMLYMYINDSLPTKH